MKLPPILTGIVLDPVAGTLDFSALGAGFDPRTVLGVLHEPSNRFVFAKGRPGLGYTAIIGSVMTLTADVSDLFPDSLTGFLDDGALIATDVRLEACRALLATGNATLSNLSSALGTAADVATGSDTAAGSLIARVARLLATQTGIATVLAAIRDRLPAALVGGRLVVDGSGVIQPVTVGNAFVLDATAQAGNTSAAATAAALGTSADAATASGANTTAIGALRAIRDRLLGTLTVSGTVTSNQGAAGAAAWKVDGSATTQPVSAAALPLPAGAATAASQATAVTALGAPADAAYAGAGSSSIIAALKGIYTALLAATPAGANLIGRVGLDQTTPGTTNGVVVNSSALPAGAASAANQATEITALQALNLRTSFGGDYAGSLAAGAPMSGQSFTASTGLAGNPARGPSSYTKFKAFFSSSAAGTAYIDGSNDNSSWQPLTSGALSAGAGMFLSTPIVFTYYRGRVVNGGAAAGGTLIQAGLSI